MIMMIFAQKCCIAMESVNHHLNCLLKITSTWFEMIHKLNINSFFLGLVVSLSKVKAYLGKVRLWFLTQSQSLIWISLKEPFGQNTTQWNKLVKIMTLIWRVRKSWWKRQTMPLSQTNAINVTLHPSMHGVWRFIWKYTAEKSQCNQCGYASSQAGSLRRHLKIHSGETKQMQSVWICLFSGRQFEATFENTWWRKIPSVKSFEYIKC